VERMLPLLTLGVLVAGFCPALLWHPSSALGQEALTQEDQENGMHVDKLTSASSSMNFAFILYKQLALKNPDKNIIFSPLGVSSALAFLSLGARSTTLTELFQGLKFNLTETSEAEIHQSFQHLLHTLIRPSEQLQLNVGNAMFIKEQLKLLEKFREDAKELYTSQALETNFQDFAAAKKFINDYVEKKTRGKIVDLVKDINSPTEMMLVNYIFFKAKWKTPFDPRETFTSRFYLSNNKWIRVPIMRSIDLATPYFRDEALSCTVVELMYSGNASALFILPDEGKMKDIEAKLLPETLRRWRASLKTRIIDAVYLPKFSISGDYNLKKVLVDLGIKKVFTREADLSGITGAKNLVLSEVVHKAMLDVAEKGTEAAVSPGGKIVFLNVKPNPIIVNFNRPFLMVITDKDPEQILFIGKVTNPKQA
uniref:Serpin family A member 3 n=1 Tax=Otolemur garnettii TaxID=30611 RepID=H0X6H7_OTOGA